MTITIPTDPAVVIPILLLALVAVGVYNSINKLFKDWAKAAGAPAKPQSITLKTDKTPLEIVQAARAARNARRRFLLLVFVGIWIGARFLWPVAMEGVEETIADGLVGLMSLLGSAFSNLAGQLESYLSS